MSFGSQKSKKVGEDVAYPHSQRNNKRERPQDEGQELLKRSALPLSRPHSGHPDALLLMQSGQSDRSRYTTQGSLPSAAAACSWKQPAAEEGGGT